MRGLRFTAGLLIALTLHTVLNKFSPGFLEFFDPYMILVIYYAMGGRLVGAILAGVGAGMIQDAFTISIPGLHSFTLTLSGYIVAVINLRLALNGILAFGGCLLGASLFNELLAHLLTTILLPQPIPFHPQLLIARAVVTTMSGMLLYQLFAIVLKREPLDVARKPKTW